MDEKIRREEMSDIDAMNAMEEIDRISTGEGADELNGVWSSAARNIGRSDEQHGTDTAR